jgi:hypothetical protein
MQNHKIDKNVIIASVQPTCKIYHGGTAIPIQGPPPEINVAANM